MKKILVLGVLFILLSSHELFLKADTHFLKTNHPSSLYLFNGTFDVSENIITRDRITQARIVGADYEFFPQEADYFDKGLSTYLKFKTGGAGTYVAGISTYPRVIELDAKGFQDYLEHEGLHEILEERKRKGVSNKPAREKYSKHVKALLQVGNKRSDHFKSTFNYPIEFIPIKNPYTINIGDTMEFLLLFDGQPLANKTVHIGFKGKPGHNTEEIASQTNENGKFSFPVKEAGKWYVATIFMVESKEPGLDYESNWATLTFEMK